MKSFATLLGCLCLPVGLLANETLAATTARTPATPATLLIREVRYDGKIGDDEARFVVDLVVESLGRGEVIQPLFEGELAVLPPKLPDGLRLEREGNQYRLAVPKPGKFQFTLELVARITRAEPWSQVSFKGPVAATRSWSPMIPSSIPKVRRCRSAASTLWTWNARAVRWRSPPPRA